MSIPLMVHRKLFEKSFGYHCGLTLAVPKASFCSLLLRGHKQLPPLFTEGLKGKAA